MSYSKELFEYALGILNQRRNDAKAKASARKTELYRHLPRLREIENELAGTGMELVHAVMAGGKDTKEAVAAVKSKNLTLQQERAALLHHAGVEANYLEPVFVCAKCKDEGYISGTMCDCMEKILRDEKLRRLNSTSSLSLSSFSNFRLDYYPTAADNNGISPRKRMEDIFKLCQQFAAGFDERCDKNLLMLGATGLGKTHLSLAIASEVIAKGYEVIYGSVQDLFRRAEDEKFSREGTSYDTLEALLECDLLILDDLGSEFVTSFTTAMLYNIINTRINHRKPTIISTNLPFKELDSQYADRVVSRMIGNYNVLQFQGNDIRRIMLSAR
ncbi:ATP-binding protein [Hydrogenoanaerobacterium sp.]|uniref:ATP-binding protein n=1 Tax=Hydrogenoanaerobacterium sp. TaxID=2953763 RepID=UPI00289D80D9|nr:ATP-binding protein [Hydrogenoanaerobacterium sp.]